MTWWNEESLLNFFHHYSRHRKTNEGIFFSNSKESFNSRNGKFTCFKIVFQETALQPIATKQWFRKKISDNKSELQKGNINKDTQSISKQRKTNGEHPKFSQVLTPREILNPNSKYHDTPMNYQPNVSSITNSYGRRNSKYDPGDFHFLFARGFNY